MEALLILVEFLKGKIMRILLVMSFSVFCYLMGTIALVYTIGFLLDVGVPKTVNSPVSENGILEATLSNVLLLSGYFMIHSIMARSWFKSVFTRYVPEGLERSIYLLVAGCSLFGLVWLWQPIALIIWQFDEGIRIALYVGNAFGWLMMAVSTLSIDYLSFFGLKQAWQLSKRSSMPAPVFNISHFYRFIRHPISLGWLIVVWMVPVMTFSHLTFALISTIYILMVTPAEEADLTKQIGNPYKRYKGEVPRFFPRLFR